MLSTFKVVQIGDQSMGTWRLDTISSHLPAAEECIQGSAQPTVSIHFVTKTVLIPS
jgi:hypothetical protein